LLLFHGIFHSFFMASQKEYVFWNTLHCSLYLFLLLFFDILKAVIRVGNYSLKFWFSFGLMKALCPRTAPMVGPSQLFSPLFLRSSTFCGSPQGQSLLLSLSLSPASMGYWVL
jgi:hypothetical protein